MSSGTITVMKNYGSGLVTGYVASSDCRWTITAPPGSTISITFSAFNVEYAYDFVRIFNCNNANFQTFPNCNLVSTSGNVNLVQTSPYTSTTGTLMVQLTSDGSVEYSGFTATYSITGCAPSPCNAGYTGPNGGPCTACVAGTYKTSPGSSSCAACGTGKTSPVGSTQLSACICMAGYSAGPGATECFHCNSVPNAQTITSGYYTGLCGCNHGYYGKIISPGDDLMGTNTQWTLAQSGGTCYACAAGKWAYPEPNLLYDTTATQTCANCPADKTSEPASVGTSGSTACLLQLTPCNAGYTGPDGGPCTACVAGKYKTSAGSSTCTNCASDKTSPTGSDDVADCVCNAGFTGPDAGSCTACVAGKYKTMTGSVPCTDCATGKYSTITGATSETVCGCLPGYAGHPYSCGACVRGKYSLGGAVADCTDCINYGPRNPDIFLQYGSGSAATACFDCYSVSNAFLASSASLNMGLCICNEGYYGLVRVPGRYDKYGVDQTVYTLAQSGGVCYACPAGKYDSVTEKEYASTENSQCTSCPAGKTSDGLAATTVDVCYSSAPTTCPTGQYVPDLSATSCVACDAGKYKNTTGTEVCTACPASSTSPSGSAFDTSCTCNAGHTGPNGGPCTACVAGTYKTSAGSHPCSNCVAYTYSTTIGATQEGQCVACPVNTISTSGSDALADCLCIPGYTGPDGGTCTACVAGKYKTVSGSAACANCGAGKYSTSIGATLEATCLACPINSNSPSGSASLSICTCNVGFTGPDGSSCTACVAGKYKTSSGSAACTDCVAGKYSTSTGATLEATCLACPSYSNSPSASASLSICTCNVGFTGPDGGLCAACGAGKYKTLTGSAACTDCGAGKYSTSTGAISSAVCTDCGAGKYSTITGAISSAACTDCGAGKYSTSIGAISSAACTDCGAGKYSTSIGAISNAVCIDCGAGKYSTSIGAISSAVCTDCGAGKYSTSTGAISSAACIDCGAGKYSTSTGAISNAVCIDCAAGKYSTSTGATLETTCLACPSNSNSPSGSTAISICTCNVGFTGPDGGSCAACGAGKYKATSGSAACTDCLENSASPAASSAVTSCQCNAGYTGPNGGPCIECEANFYKDTVGPAACSACPAGSASPAASVSSTACGCGSSSYMSVSNLSFPVGIQTGYTTSNAMWEACGVCYDASYSSVTTISNIDTCRNAAGSQGWILMGSKTSIASTSFALAAFIKGSNFITSSSLTVPYLSNGAYWYYHTTKSVGFTSETTINLNPYDQEVSKSICSYTNFYVYCEANAKNFAGADRSPSKAIDFNTATNYQSFPYGKGWLMVDLRQTFYVTHVVLQPSYPGTDLDFNVRVGNNVDYAQNPICYTSNGQMTTAVHTIYCNMEGRYVSYDNYNDGWINIIEFTAYGYQKKCDKKLSWNLDNNGGYISGCTPGLNTNQVWRKMMHTCFSGSACISCPPNSAGAAGSTTRINCQCNAGYTGPNGGPCTACQENFYKDTVGLAACSACPANSTSLAGSTAVTSCQCKAGYTGPNGGPCTECQANFYKDTIGPAACTQCNLLAQSPAGSNSSARCICRAGYYGSNQNNCQQCASHTYSDTPGSLTCLQCPSNSEAFGLNDQKEDCKCNKGYSGADGSQCNACSAQFYKDAIGSANCSSCPVTTVSNIASTALTSCKCNVGYSGPDGSICDMCPAGYFKNTTGSASCTACPVNSFSDNASTALTSCKCNKGYTGADGGTCNACNAGFYKNTIGSGVCLACPSNSISNIASDAVTNCKCNKGYSGADGSQCIACSANFYKDAIGSENCTACPVTTVSNVASTVLTNCRCNVGYSGPDGSICDTCLEGYYKNTVGSASCSACPANTISNITSVSVTNCKCNMGFTGADGGPCHACDSNSYKDTLGSSNCTKCPANSVSFLESKNLQDCQCAKGHSGEDGGPCIACYARFYKDTVGTANCSACPANSVSLYGSVALQDCKCDPGYFGMDGGVCTECAAGTFKETNGSHACTLCDINKYGITLAEISDASCLNCPGNSTSVKGSDKPELCFCDSGFEQSLSFDKCTECRPGFYDNALDRHECSSCGAGLYSASWGAKGPETCKECSPGTWSEIGSPTCQMCPPNSNSSVKSGAITDCKCLPGAQGEDGQTCELCFAGFYKKGSGNGTCQMCAWAYSYSEIGSASCQCNLGYTGPDDGECTQCAMATYKNISGSIACYNCFPNSDSGFASTNKSDCLCNAGYESTGEDNCTACALGKAKAYGLGNCIGCLENMQPDFESMCQCNAGYRELDNACSACEKGTYKSTLGNSSIAIADCDPVEKFSPLTGTIKPSCCKCQPNRTTLDVGSNQSSSCLCNAGFGGSDCHACAHGTYKSNVSMHDCMSCPKGSTTLSTSAINISDCVSAPGYYGNISSGFFACAAGSYSEFPATHNCTPCASGAMSPVGASSPSQCGCSQNGYVKKTNVKVFKLTVSQFAFYIDNERRPILKLFSPGSYTFDSSDQSNIGHHIAFKTLNEQQFNTGVVFKGIPGYAGSSVVITIAEATTFDLKYYCLEHGNLMGNYVNISNQVLCTCESGYSREINSAECTICAENYFCIGGDIPAQACANASVSRAGSKNQSQCVCLAGYSGQDGGPCNPCKNGEWKSMNGSSACIQCLPNKTSALGSISSASCLCKPGYSGVDGGPCFACPIGFYKQSEGDLQCSKCSSNQTTLQEASINYTDCLCNSGFELLLHNNFYPHNCTACPVGKYKQKPSIPQSCVSCPANTTTENVGTSEYKNCLCVAGYYQHAANSSSCTLCPVDTYKNLTGSFACTLCPTNSVAPRGSNTPTACKCLSDFTGPDGGPCQKCPANSSAPLNSKSLTSCKCFPGFTGADGGQCMPCGAGQYKSVNGSSNCVQCPENSMSFAMSTNIKSCTCVSGYVGAAGGPCTACPPGTYVKSASCVACPANSMSQPASAQITACTCTAGYSGPAGGPCTACSIGFYKSSTDQQCVKCPDNTRTLTAAATSVTECQSIAGFQSTEIKAPWVKMTLKINNDQVGRYTLSSVQANLKRAVASAARKACKCNVTEDDILILDAAARTATARRLLQDFVEVTVAVKIGTLLNGEDLLSLLTLSDIISALQEQGENLDVTEIPRVLMAENIVFAEACPENTYKAEMGNSSCMPCPPQSSSPLASTGPQACICNANLIKKSDGSCDRVCAAGSEASEARTGNDTITACVACRPSYYKSEEGEHACTPCPVNSFSESSNQISITSCLCIQGYIWNATTQNCDACPAGTFNNQNNENVCYQCSTICPTRR